jgi:hypothetical protein
VKKAQVGGAKKLIAIGADNCRRQRLAAADKFSMGVFTVAGSTKVGRQHSSLKNGPASAAAQEARRLG